MGETGYRKDYAIIAHKEGKILVVKILGYDVFPWRIPQDRRNPDDDHEVRVTQILEQRVGCSDVEYVRDTGIMTRVKYSDDDRQSYDPRTTSRIYIGKMLHFYLVKLLCDEREFRKGERVDGIKMMNGSALRNWLHPKESAAIELVLQQYALTEKFFDDLSVSLAEKSKGEK